MAKVTFKFDEMFLFAVRKDCLTVLAPKTLHRCFFSGPGLPEIELTDHVVTLFKGKQRAKGKITNHAARYMVHLDDVLGVDGYQLKEVGALTDLAPAVFELGGTTTSLEGRPLSPPTGDPKFRDVKWLFGGHFSHRLTNRAEFLLEAGPNYRLEIKERGTGAVVASVALAGGQTFAARTADHPKDSLAERRTVREFALFYDFLVDRDGNPVMGPIPYDPTPETPAARARRLKKRRTATGIVALCIEPVCPNAMCAAS